MTFIKKLPRSVKQKYDITVISPRNYFLYTPLLPAVASGTVEQRSIVEPVRNLVHGKGNYYEASVSMVDPAKKIIKAAPVKSSNSEEQAEFEVNYDVLVVGVGSVNTTFGTPGVQEYCHFFKSIEDANKLRSSVSDRFEQANFPRTTLTEMKNLLTFIVVGGGPTGVEVAAEMHDIVQEDLKKAWPHLQEHVQIILVEMMPSVLAMYSKEASKYTVDQFNKVGIKTMFETKVSAIKERYIEFQNKEGTTQSMPYGLCVWATGVGLNPLVKQMQQVTDQASQHFRGLAVDSNLSVKGTKGSIFAVGDCATIIAKKAHEHADELFTLGDQNHDQKLQLGELGSLLHVASNNGYDHLKEHAEFLQTKFYSLGDRRTNAFTTGLQNVLKSKGVQGNHPSQMLGDYTDTTELTLGQFKDLLKQMDARLSPLPPTAQVAAQEGTYLAKVFQKHNIDGQHDLAKDKIAPFSYNHTGAFAYVGQDLAVMDSAQNKSWVGYSTGWAWKAFETSNQISFRNRLNVTWDWIRVKTFGRDITRH